MEHRALRPGSARQTWREMEHRATALCSLLGRQECLPYLRQECLLMPVAESKKQVQAGGDGPQRLKPLFRCGITARLKSYPDAKPSLEAKRGF